MPTKRSLRLLLAATLLGTGLVAVGAVPALAADGCGSGFHKQEDGVISGSKSASFDGKSMKASESGYVRWCTRTVNNWRDQWYQRVMVGVPTAITFRGHFSGTHRTKICLTASFTASIKGGDWADITIGTDGASVTITHSNDHSKTVSQKLCATGAKAQSTTALLDRFANFSATAPKYEPNMATCPHISAVTVATTLTMVYNYGSTKRSYNLRSTNTDVPNNYPSVAC